MAMAIAMATAMRLAGDKEGKGKVCKGDSNGNEGDRQRQGLQVSGLQQQQKG